MHQQYTVWVYRGKSPMLCCASILNRRAPVMPQLKQILEEEYEQKLPPRISIWLAAWCNENGPYWSIDRYVCIKRNSSRSILQVNGRSFTGRHLLLPVLETPRRWYEVLYGDHRTGLLL